MLYEEKTGNQWKDRHNFVKIPDRFYPVDVDYEQTDENTLKIEESSEPSKLAKPVQDLVKLIFDISSMKKVMLEFEVCILFCNAIAGKFLLLLQKCY